jgi:hypothetical protein
MVPVVAVPLPNRPGRMVDKVAIVPVIFSPLTYAVLPERISPATAVASLVSTPASKLPSIPKIVTPLLIFSAFKLVSPLMVCFPVKYYSFSMVWSVVVGT